MNFKNFKTAVQKRFAEMSKFPLFEVHTTKEELWDTYLQSFPKGSDPLFKERSQHNCNCCKNFIRTVGNVIAIINGKKVSIWDTQIPNEPEYQVVTDAMAALVASKPIRDSFLHYEQKAGTDTNAAMIGGDACIFHHFYLTLPKEVVKPKADIPTILNDIRTSVQVFSRSLMEIDLETVDTVLELISQNSIYRGQEHKFAVETFRKHKIAYDKLSAEEKDLYVWNSKDIPASVTRIRNSAIGTLLTDIASGEDLEKAVKSFEAKVAPTNYKRSTALVTKGMIEQAKKTLIEKNLMSALDRRFAVLSDITINNVLFADRSAKKVLTKDVFDDLVSKSAPKAFDKLEEVSIEKFISDILPKVESMEVFFESGKTGNLVSLITAADPTANSMFKWNNQFSWSYNGEVADSIKERVKKAGGSVEGDMCCRLAWFNYDDLDFHMIEPNGYEIYFSNRSITSPCGGRLDVDMNAGCGSTREAVENIFYKSKTTMKEGIYRLVVNNFCRRENIDTGFEVEIDLEGKVYKFAYDNVPNRANVEVAQIKYTRSKGFEIVKSLPYTSTSKEVWNIMTGQFQKVNVVMKSPNFWDDQKVGNEHYFFMIDGCANDGLARGFYNEFLHESLMPNRKALEVVGCKLAMVGPEEQLSGFGFSTTKRDSLICRVSGKVSRTLKIVF